MKYRHYAPTAPLVLFPAGVGVLAEDVASRLLAALSTAILEGKTVGAIVSNEVAEFLPPTVTTVAYGSRRCPDETAAGLYEALRFFDTHLVDVIFAEGVREAGIGRALMNRLYKAASSVEEGQ